MTITYTTRPTTFDDLNDYERAGHIVATVNSDFIVKHPSLGMHLLAAISEAPRLGMVVEDGVISVPLTDAELEAKLTAAQRSWDASRDWYEAARADAAATESWKRHSVDRWATAEGLPAIEWPA